MLGDPNNPIPALTPDEVEALNRSITTLRELLAKVPLRDSPDPARPTERMAPEFFVARTPPGGIPALTKASGTGLQDTPGWAMCDVYQLIDSFTATPYLSPLTFGHPPNNVSVKERVFWLGADPVPGDVWVHVAKDKLGAWHALALLTAAAVINAVITDFAPDGPGHSAVEVEPTAAPPGWQFKSSGERLEWDWAGGDGGLPLEEDNRMWHVPLGTVVHPRLVTTSEGQFWRFRHDDKEVKGLVVGVQGPGVYTVAETPPNGGSARAPITALERNGFDVPVGQTVYMKDFGARNPDPDPYNLEFDYENASVGFIPGPGPPPGTPPTTGSAGGNRLIIVIDINGVWWFFNWVTNIWISLCTGCFPYFTGTGTGTWYNYCQWITCEEVLVDIDIYCVNGRIIAYKWFDQVSVRLDHPSYYSGYGA